MKFQSPWAALGVSEVDYYETRLKCARERAGSARFRSGAECLSEWLNLHGLSQTNAAEVYGCSKPYMNRLVRGHETFSYQVALKLEELFGVPADQLVLSELEKNRAKQ